MEKARLVFSAALIASFFLQATAFRINAKSVQVATGRVPSGTWGSCKAFGSSSAKSCTGNISLFPQILDDQHKCAELCEVYTTHNEGDSCCIFLSDHRCGVSAGGVVVDAANGTMNGKATACSYSSKMAPDWQIPHLPTDRMMLLKKIRTIGSTPEERASRLRAIELAQESDFMDPALFRAITARGVMQGAIGDCWLIAAISSFARFPNAVRALFPQQSFLTQDGEYQVQLYNIADHTWVSVAVNDEVESDGKGGARKAKLSNAREIWPVILEKAFAKLVNRDVPIGFNMGYSRLDGGIPAWGLIALTGNENQWEYTNGAWLEDDPSLADMWIPEKLDSEETAKRIKSGVPKGYRTVQEGATLNSEIFWFKMRTAMMNNYLMWAAVFKTDVGERGEGANGEVLRTDGIFEGHAYSVLNVVEVDPGKPLYVCQEEVEVRYLRPEDAQAMQKRMDGDRFRGWGVGDIVWSHFKAADGSKAKLMLRFRVTGLSDANSTDCEGEPCISYDMNPSPEDAKRGVQEWAGVPLLPLSWIVGSRQGGHTESHGVKPGWRIISQVQSSNDSSLVAIFNGIVDQAVCEEATGGASDRKAKYIARSLPSIQEVTRLVRIRNPWGNAEMYNGKWSDYDLDTWSHHPDLADALNFIPAPDGAWWMDYESFAKKFQMVGISEFNMAIFSPPPAKCSTNWGATHYLPFGPEPLPLDWKTAQQKPAANQCAWCVALERGIMWSSESCSDAFQGAVAHKAYARRGSIKLCCAVVE